MSTKAREAEVADSITRRPSQNLSNDQVELIRPSSGAAAPRTAAIPGDAS